MKITSSFICLDDLHIYAYHGVSSQETKIGNEFRIDLKLKTDFSKALLTDEVTDTISYADVYEIVKEEMLIPSKLLEHICGRLVKRLFKEFRNVEEIEIKLAKRNPPMGADIDAAGVGMLCIRE